MILSCQHISKAFGDNPILRDISFGLESGEKTALIGVNGAGKTTLLRLITGELSADSGQVACARDARIGYLAQHIERSSSHTVYEEVLEARAGILELEQQMRRAEQEMKDAPEGTLPVLMERYARLTQSFERENGFAWQSEVRGVLNGLGFAPEEYSRPFHTLSGGQKTRVTLGRLLLERPDILILDEPTNHLDIDAISWLEDYLRAYAGTVLIVSHDRYFLDRVVTRVLELENGRLTSYPFSYTGYAAAKAERRRAELAAWTAQQQEIRHQQEVISRLRSYNREKSIRRAESREKVLARMDLLEKPRGGDAGMHILLEADEVSGSDVLAADGLEKSYDGETLFSGLSFSIRRGDRIGLVGANGTGKTTILKILNGLVLPDRGEFRYGTKVHVGYYDQEQQRLHDDLTLFDELREARPDMTDTEIRSTLASFLFTGDDVWKKVGDLSGGERGKLALAKLILSPCNFLILDEPTNHLDMASCDVLEEALSSYSGTLLTVSHDRYFLNRVCTSIWELSRQRLTEYLGNYQEYQEKKASLSAVQAAEADEEPSVPAAAGPERSDSALQWKEQKDKLARERKRQNDIRRTENEITACEERISEIESELAREEVYTDASRCMDLTTEKTDCQNRIEQLFQLLEELEDAAPAD